MGDRSVLVTGAARGIGRATCEAFAFAGWTVFAGVRDPAALEPFPIDTVRVVELDVTAPATISTAVAQATEAGALECLVNNAGYALFGAVEEADLAEARAMFDTNLFGALAVTQAIVPGMREAGGGTIVNVSSIAARITAPLFGIYYASKYALRSVSEALAMEGAPHGIRVAMIEPGMVDTEFSQSAQRSGPAASGEGPYGQLAGELVAGFRSWRGRVNTPSAEVAESILAAANGAGAFHMLVGDDSRELASLRANSDDEQMLQHVREYLGLDSLLS
jgi:NAD(P)-dependent dehydrogenase (short-subunit alcohol dehydrogenase family)